MLGMILDGVLDSVADQDGGAVADYIPGLAKVDPEQLGMAMTTITGKTYSCGDADTPFTIQSVSKPFTFAIALEECGFDEVYQKVGTEPSGDDFNSVALNPATGVPFNPMINSGAIAMTGMLRDKHGPETMDVIRAKYSELAGADLEIDEDIFASEIDTGHRNHAIAYLLRAAGVLTDPVDEVLELYTHQCSLKVTAKQLSTMGATIANIGTNPLTKAVVVDPLVVRHVLSVMFTCGMYNYAGRWAVDVGLPAKSGVAGSVMAVVNRQIGIATFSPRLDERGNSVRGIKACVQLAEELGLHAFEFSNAGSAMLDVYLKDENES